MSDPIDGYFTNESIIMDGLMSIIESAYRRDTLSPAYIHLVRAEIRAFLSMLLAERAK